MLRPDNSTLVHVLVHRESEEYKNSDDEDGGGHVSPASLCGHGKFERID